MMLLLGEAGVLERKQRSTVMSAEEMEIEEVQCRASPRVEAAEKVHLLVMMCKPST